MKPLLAGIAAAGVQLGVGELAAALLPGARSPLTGMGRALIDLTPGPLVDVTVALVEAKDKPLLTANLLLNHVAVGAAAGQLWGARRATATGLFVGHGLLGGAAAASRPDSDGASSLAAGALGTGAGYATLHQLGRDPLPIAIATTAAAGALAGGLAMWRTRAAMIGLERRRSAQALPVAADPLPPAPAEADFAIEGLSPLFTPNVDFYETDVTLPPPALDSQNWRLRVDGLVDVPVDLTYGELLDLGLVEVDSTLVCVHNPVGGDRIGTARWTGVPLAVLLARIGVAPGADHLLAHSVDGFTAGVSLALATDELDALVVVGMNGEPLPFGHGFPARLLVPGLYGYDANTKWLSRLELTTSAAVRDYWSRRGWPRTPAHVRAGSRIDVPGDRAVESAGDVVIAGVAWAPPRGVTDVEVSIDGRGWRHAELSREASPTAWRRWRYDWTAEPGAHELRVRASGQDGATSGHDDPPFPYGAAGYHTIQVEIVSGNALPGKGPRGRGGDLVAEASRRTELASTGLASWLRHGFPRSRFGQSQ